MADKWEDKGVSDSSTLTNLVTSMFGLDAGDRHNVENTETGETKVVDRYSGQTVGEAISNGQFRDK